MIEVVNIKYSDSFIRVDLDNGEILSLPHEIFSLYSISKGKIIDNILHQQLKEESARFNCKQKALNYLATRSRSNQEMKNYLIKKNFPTNIIDEILIKLKESGYINDFDYAVRFIANKKRSKTVGRNLLKKDLFGKGINREIIDRAIKDTESEKSDPEEIYELALKKLKSIEGKKNQMQKIAYSLRQKGFDEDEIRTAIGKLKIDENQE
jgi:regulatory protein